MNNNLRETIKRHVTTINEFYQKGTYGDAVVALRELESLIPNDQSMRYNKHGILIDAGGGLHDVELIREGIRCGEALLEGKSFPQKLSQINYNLANAYKFLYEIEEYPRFELIPNSKNLQHSKQLNRVALEHVGNTDTDLKKRILVNLANCLNSLGRGVEAIDLHEDALRLDQTFSMAIINRASALVYFADVCGKHRAATYLTAYKAITSVLPKEDVLTVGGASARAACERLLDRIRNVFKNKEYLETELDNSPYDSSALSEFERFYVEECARERLFLNFHIYQPNAEAAVYDSIMITMVTPWGEDQKFYYFANFINQLKEDFASARLLLMQSRYASEELNKISRRTVYVDSLEYARFDLHAGLMKAAFRLSFGILDKIAGFLTEYFNLTDLSGRIYYHSIWHKKKENSLREELLKTNDISLFGLYDICRDLHHKGYLGHIGETRNALSHRNIMIYDLSHPSIPHSSANGLLFKELNEYTLDLMRLVRAAIIYLVTFVNNEEAKKHGDGGNIIPYEYFTM